MEEGWNALATGAVFRLEEEVTVAEPELLHRLDLLEGSGPGVRETVASYRRLAAELREPESAPYGALTERMEYVRATRGAAADYLLQQGEDDLSEAGENYLRSSEWARRVLALAPWDAPAPRVAAAALLEHMAELEEEAFAGLVRFAGGQP